MDEHEQLVLFARQHIRSLKIAAPAIAGTNQKRLWMFSRCSRLMSSERKVEPNQRADGTAKFVAAESILGRRGDA
jgi:hypothetical protein